jgi:hypothetical protein
MSKNAVKEDVPATAEHVLIVLTRQAERSLDAARQKMDWLLSRHAEELAEAQEYLSQAEEYAEAIARLAVKAD